MNEFLLKEDIIIEGIRGALFHSLLIEGQKGCDPFIWKTHIDMEPVFEPYEISKFLKDEEKKAERKALKEPRWNQKCLRLWMPAGTESNWTLWEEVLKELTVVKKKLSFEILGNEQRVSIQLVVDTKDSVPVMNAIRSKFPGIEFEELRDDPLAVFTNLQSNKEQSLQFLFLDYYPTPPYFRNLTSYETMPLSPLSSFYPSLSSLSPEEMGLYQVLFQPCRKKNNWHRNILNLVEAEYKAGKYGSLNVDEWFSPAQGHEVLHEAEKKAHPEKPFFAVCVRIGVLCEQHKVEECTKSISLALSKFRYGSMPLNTLNKWHYLSVLGGEGEISKLLYERSSCRQGMILNSAELVALCHPPTKEILESKSCSVDKLTQIHSEKTSTSGIVLGTNEYAGRKEVIRQPEEVRCRHTVILGKIGMGKSVLLENMVLQDIESGNGLAVIDPHGELVEKILTLIPEHRIQDVIFIDPCDEDYVVCFNPLEIPDVSEAGKVADDFTVCFRNLFTSWGERMENIFRHSFYALLKAKYTSLADLRTILSKDSAGDKLRRRVLPILQNEEAVRFWTEDFPGYHPSALDPVLNKLSKFLLNDRVARIFQQKISKLDFRSIMDSRKILLLHLPAGILGSDSTNVIGSLALALFYHAAMSRADSTPEERVPFYLYVDEFHRFPTKSAEDLLREARKYKLGMIIAYQQREQISESVRIALGNAGSMIAFGLGLDDAQRIFKEFGGQIEMERFMTSSVGEAYAMIENGLTSLTTFRPKQSEGGGFSRQIRDFSRARYYAERKLDGAEKCAENRKSAEATESGVEEIYDEFQ
jgi:hypothetical protein